jgi:hypothetical protein
VIRSRIIIPLVAVAAVLTLSAQAQRRTPPENIAPAGGLRTSDTTILINKVMPSPPWALAERLNAEGAALWAEKYLDANGHLRGVANFGIADGPDDAVESIRNWPLAHATGGAESIIELWISRLSTRPRGDQRRQRDCVRMQALTSSRITRRAGRV